MNDNVLYDDDTEQVKHLKTIHALAAQSGRPEREVVRVYEDELRLVLASARIRDFLPILIGRRVRDRLAGRIGAPL